MARALTLVMKNPRQRLILAALALTMLSNWFQSAGSRQLACVTEYGSPEVLNLQDFPLQPELFQQLGDKDAQNSAAYYYQLLQNNEMNYLVGVQNTYFSYGLSSPFLQNLNTPLLPTINASPFNQGYFSGSFWPDLANGQVSNIAPFNTPTPASPMTTANDPQPHSLVGPVAADGPQAQMLVSVQLTNHDFTTNNPVFGKSAVGLGH